MGVTERIVFLDRFLRILHFFFLLYLQYEDSPIDLNDSRCDIRSNLILDS